MASKRVSKCRSALTYLILVAAVVSVHQCRRGVPQGLVHGVAQSVLLDSRHMLQDVESVLKVLVRLDDNLY